MKDRRVPKGISRRTGYWKAAEIQKFFFAASKLVLDGIVLDDNYEVWITLVRIVELVFGCGRSQLTPDALQTLEKLINYI